MTTQAKIKLVVSDLHIGRGRVLANGALNILEDFVADRQFVEFLEFYSTGPYYDADVELILNGDIFNNIQVDYRGYHSPILTESISREKLQVILKGHPRIVSALKAFTAAPHHKLTYVVGNHDVEMIWEQCQELLSETLGHPVQFKNFAYQVDGVHIEHGHQCESLNRLNPKQMFLTKGLKEPILNLPWGSHFVINFVIPIKLERPAIDKVRPLPAFFRWSFWNDTLWFLKTLVRAIFYFLATRFSKSLYRTNNLVTTLKILKDMAIAPQLSKAARSLLAENRELHTVIMGHTHTPRHIQFGDGKEYLNSGTWTEVTSLDLMHFGKGTRYTYVLIDYTRNPARPHAFLREWMGRWHEDLDLYAG
jgi:UDP-2,3-diacylglucosamine pyrophosphatase LpxH